MADYGLLLAPAPRAAPTVAPAFPEGPIATASSESIHTAAWRTFTPQIHLEHCTKCNFCWKFCPDDAIDFDAQGFPRIKLDYCKGCGICATECPPKTIEMVAVA
ncbi:MAG: 4Fe-4S dicluster-binding protein [Thermoplasmata archaeon]